MKLYLQYNRGKKINDVIDGKIKLYEYEIVDFSARQPPSVRFSRQ